MDAEELARLLDEANERLAEAEKTIAGLAADLDATRTRLSAAEDECARLRRTHKLLGGGEG